MKIKLILIGLIVSLQSFGQSYKKIHQRAIVVDTHNDILMKAADVGIVFDQNLKGKTHSDLARWKTGGLDVQFFSVYCDGDLKNAFTYANRQIDSLDAVIARNPDKIVKVSSYATLLQTVHQKKIAALCGVEGGHMIEDNLDKLDNLYHRGARYLTLTHNIAPTWATSAVDETYNPNLLHKGLTDFGIQVVKHMNQIGMIVDISHSGDQTFWDVINTSTKPIMASHSSVYSLVPHPRNLKDDQIKAIAKNGGVIQINFNPGFIDPTFEKKEMAFLLKHKEESDALMKAGMMEFYAVAQLFDKYKEEANAMRPPLAMLIQHIEYIINLVGIDYVGLGSDFDGIYLTPQQLDDVTTYPIITKVLVEKGYNKKDITKILGGNMLRVLKANELK